MASTTDLRLTTPSDEEWGYEFGIDGLMKTSDAAEFFGVSRNTITRWIEKGDLRAGCFADIYYICRRSIRDLLRRMEGHTPERKQFGGGK